MLISISHQMDGISGSGNFVMYTFEIYKMFPLFHLCLNEGSNDIPSLYIVIKSPLLMLRGLMEGFQPNTKLHLLGQMRLLKEYYTLMNKLVSDWLEVQFSFISN